MLISDYYKLKFYTYLWFHPFTVFWATMIFYLTPAIVAVIFYPELLSNVFFIAAVSLLFISRTCIWIKAKLNFPYYHKSMEWIKWRIFKYLHLWDFLVRYIDEHHVYTAVYGEKLKNGRHRIRLREGNSPDFPKEGWKDKGSDIEVLSEEIFPVLTWIDEALKRMKKKKQLDKAVGKIYGKDIADFYKTR